MGGICQPPRGRHAGSSDRLEHLHSCSHCTLHRLHNWPYINDSAPGIPDLNINGVITERGVINGRSPERFIRNASRHLKLVESSATARIKTAAAASSHGVGWCITGRHSQSALDALDDI